MLQNLELRNNKLCFKTNKIPPLLLSYLYEQH